MNKVIKDGHVAVLYSPGYGGGWYTWNLDYPEIIFDPGAVDLVERGRMEELLAYATLKWPQIYLGGLEQLKVKWIKEGTAFRIEEYDGSESLQIQKDIDWFIA